MRAVWFLPLLLLAAPVRAGDLVVAVATPDGRPVTDAVVTAHPAQPAAGAAPRFPWPLKVDQRNMQFEPFVLIVPVGGEVAFPNRDAVRHHVYSFSPIRRFELKLYGRDESRTVRFDKPGAVALGCNIHDGMVAFIRVVDTPFAAKSEANGQAVIRGVPAGAATLRVWHPYSKAPGNETVQSLAVPRSGETRRSVVLQLRPPPKRSHHY